MDCRELRETISAFVDGETTPGESAQVREHLVSCPRCRVLEARMRALGDGILQLHAELPKCSREAVFARLEAKGAIPPKNNASTWSWRWAAVPLAVAAAFGLFLLASRESVRVRTAPGPKAARVETPASGPQVPDPGRGGHPPRTDGTPHPGTPSAPRDVPGVAPHKTAQPSVPSPALTPDEKEMVALLDVLSDPVLFEAGEDAEDLDLLDMPGHNGREQEAPLHKRGGA